MATKRSKYGPPYVFDTGPDIDLEKEDVRDIKGNRITEEYVRKAVENVHRHVAGRPSLTAPGKHSPQVAVRLPEELREATEYHAYRMGMTVSAFIREAIVEYIADAVEAEAGEPAEGSEDQAEGEG